jgi:hypothetical protein
MVPLIEVLHAFKQAVVETYTALAADPPFAIAIAQAVLHLLSQLARRMKERTALKP